MRGVCWGSSGAPRGGAAIVFPPQPPLTAPVDTWGVSPSGKALVFKTSQVGSIPTTPERRFEPELGTPGPGSNHPKPHPPA